MPSHHENRAYDDKDDHKSGSRRNERQRDHRRDNSPKRDNHDRRDERHRDSSHRRRDKSPRRDHDRRTSRAGSSKSDSSNRDHHYDQRNSRKSVEREDSPVREQPSRKGSRNKETGENVIIREVIREHHVIVEQPGIKDSKEGLKRKDSHLIEAPIAGVPPGLEYLTMIDQLLIHQSVDMLETFSDFEIENRFQIKNKMGQPVYLAAEEAGFITRQCCGTKRAFKMHISDPSGKEIMKVSRPFKCCAGCCWCAFSDCCSYGIKIEAPVGEVIGYVQQKCSCLKPSFEVFDENHDKILEISGPMFICNCCYCYEPKFYIYTKDGEKVGKVTKHWSGFVKEAFTQADNFGICFPLDLDVKLKGTLIGAVFLINIMYFENLKKSNDDSS